MRPQYLPELFKGIALFTPAGDLVYCIDPSKRGHWHINLCAILQESLGLSELPHFLVPAYTATVDRWFDSQTQQVKTLAEAYPAVKRYQPLLNAIFGTKNLEWRSPPWQDEWCNPLVIETYRGEFPQLWEAHDLIVQYQTGENRTQDFSPPPLENLTVSSREPTSQNYVLRLFIAGNNVTTKQTLKTIYQLLEKGLRHPYTLKVIDIAKYPEQAEINQVSAIPTLIRVWPLPVRRIVGQLEDIGRVLQTLTA